MNYLKELNAFYAWILTNDISGGQILLWLALLQTANRKGWPEWFTVPNATLQLMTRTSPNGIRRARNGLVDRGLILYRKGYANNQAGRFHVISFMEILSRADERTPGKLMQLPVRVGSREIPIEEIQAFRDELRQPPGDES